MYPATVYCSPDGEVWVAGDIQVAMVYWLPSTCSVATSAPFNWAPLRKPHGVSQISICCAQSVCSAGMFWVYVPAVGETMNSPPLNVSPVASDAG